MELFNRDAGKGTKALLVNARGIYHAAANQRGKAGVFDFEPSF